jgi:hypothetical protein
MTIQFAQSTAHAMLDAIETDIGASPTLYLRSGAQPRPAPGPTPERSSRPSPWRRTPSSNAAILGQGDHGALSDTLGRQRGTLGHWRIKTSGGTVKLQGSITATGGGGDMTVDNTKRRCGQEIDVTSFAINFPTANQG